MSGSFPFWKSGRRFKTIPPLSPHPTHTHRVWHSFNNCQQLKWFLLGDKLKYLLKPDALPSLHVHWKVCNKAGPSNSPVQGTETIEFGKVETFCLILILKNLKRRLFNIIILIINVFWMFIYFYIIGKAYWNVYFIIFGKI